MENKGKSRQSVTSVKKRASNYANRARYLAEAVKAGDKIFEQINTLEQNVENTTLGRKNAKNFCEKEIEGLKAILSDLEKQFTRQGNRLELTFSLFVIVINIIVFIGYYTQNIPSDLYKINPNFYVIMSIITCICLVGFFLLYFRSYKWLYINVIITILESIYSSNLRANKLFRGILILFIWSIFTGIYRGLVLAFATTVPKVFSPTMPIIGIFTAILATFVNIFNSSPIVAIATCLTILPFLISFLKKVFKSEQSK